MRESKFRGKRIDAKGWIYGYLIGKDVIVGEIVEFEDEYFCTEYWYRVDPETVGQSTGLSDKNGKEIYEGDIVRFSPYWVEHPWTSRVVWGKEFAGHVVKGKADDSEEDVLDDEMIEDAEVIGNIYEHPELLK